MSIITQDALQVIAEHLSPTSRLNLAAIDQRFFSVASRWHDVKTIVFDDADVTLAGPNIVHTFEHSAFERKRGDDENTSTYRTEAKETALSICPGVKKLVIQTRLTDFDAVMLHKMELKLTKLYISIENLSLVNFPKFSKLRTLHLVLNSTKDLKVIDVVDTRVLQAIFPPSLTRVCLTGIYLTENLLTHLLNLPNLVCLDMIGCLVDTRVGAKYVPLLEKFPLLDELSLPPSMFSFSTKAKTSSDLTFRNLSVTKLGLYMDQFDEDVFLGQTMRLMPNSLKHLVVFGNYLPLKRWKMLKTVQKFGILFGPNTALASCPQSNLTNVKLLSHLLRCPPYIPHEYNPNFHRNHDIALGNLTWQFSLLDWQGGAAARKEVHSLRTRLNVADNEEVIFEGVRIAPILIEERLRQMRENRINMAPGSPPEFQVFDPIVPIVNRHAPRAPPPRLAFGARRAANGNRRLRSVSAPAPVQRLYPELPRIPDAPPLPLAIREAPQQSDSMRTHPPSPRPPTLSGAVINNTIPFVSPIRNTTTTASQVGGTAVASSVVNTTTGSDALNRAFLGTPPTGDRTTSFRRLSTASTTANSEMTMMSTATASPEVFTARSRDENAATINTASAANTGDNNNNQTASNQQPEPRN